MTKFKVGEEVWVKCQDKTKFKGVIRDIIDPNTRHPSYVVPRLPTLCPIWVFEDKLSRVADEPELEIPEVGSYWYVKTTGAHCSIDKVVTIETKGKPVGHRISTFNCGPFSLKRFHEIFCKEKPKVSYKAGDTVVQRGYTRVVLLVIPPIELYPERLVIQCKKTGWTGIINSNSLEEGAT